MSQPTREPVRQCSACGTTLPSTQDPSDDLCDDCGLAQAEPDDCYRPAATGETRVRDDGDGDGGEGWSWWGLGIADHY